MRLPFCDHHISAFLNSWEENKPLDLALSQYLRAHKSIGAQDRRTIGELLYGMARWKTLIDYLCPSPHPQDRLACFKKISLEHYSNDPSIPLPVRLAVSEFLYDRFQAAYGKEQTETLCRILNSPAPTTVRANLIKTSRESLLERFKALEFEATPCEFSPVGIQFKKRVPLFALPEFREGLFEVQDEGSQLVAACVDAKPGESVLDFCSGSGGKTLAFAPLMQGKGQIYLHDIRPWTLLEARQRLRRAGIQNGQMLAPDHKQLKVLKGKMDWVLADVPCTGTGTLRRNPDSKWKIDAPMLERLIQQQREIVTEALTYLKPGGRLVYITCSLLPEENEKQTAHFLARFPLALEKTLSLLPKENGMDGFYCAVYRKL